MFNITNSRFYADHNNKPMLRGVLHELTLFIFPFYALYLYNVSLGTNNITRLILLIYIFSQFLCIFTSSQYHRRNWSIKNETIVRNLDHTMIILAVGGSLTPLVLLMDDYNIVNSLIALWSCILFGMIYIYNVKKNRGFVHMWMYFLILIIFTCYVKLTYKKFMKNELICLIIVIILGLAGIIIYKFKIPKLNNYKFVFSSHELFHLIIVIGGIIYTYVIIKIIQRLNIIKK